ncbi:MAG: hypothetical protein H6540_02910 [Bacteroidales bacterium]|nr:hypothetical protein [Bacteroidales bacterium]
MKKPFCYIFLFLFLSSCIPSNWLKIDVYNPAEFTFPDTGRIAVFNRAYLPSSMVISGSTFFNLVPSEQNIIDTLITANLFNGFFSITNESSNPDLVNAEYYEIRTVDTTNILKPLKQDEVEMLAEETTSEFLIVVEFYDFYAWNSPLKFYNDLVSYLAISKSLVCGVYNKSGELLDNYAVIDTMYWYSDFDNEVDVPEIPEALREAFYSAGEKYGRHISPYWVTISRPYYPIINSGVDISLDPKSLENLISNAKPGRAMKACFNLAVISERMDDIPAAIKWLDKAEIIKPSPYSQLYLQKLKKRLELKETIDVQSGIIQ